MMGMWAESGKEIESIYERERRWGQKVTRKMESSYERQRRWGQRVEKRIESI